MVKNKLKTWSPPKVKRGGKVKVIIAKRPAKEKQTAVENQTATPAPYAMPVDDLALMRIAEVMRVTGLSRATTLKMVNDGLMPRPVKLGIRFVGWRAGDIRRWLADPEGWKGRKQFKAAS